MRATLETILGLFGLLRLLVLSRFRMKGAYWQWRQHTAFGNGEFPKGQRLASILEYVRWIHQMRRQQSI